MRVSGSPSRDNERAMPYFAKLAAGEKGPGGRRHFPHLLPAPKVFGSSGGPGKPTISETYTDYVRRLSPEQGLRATMVRMLAHDEDPEKAGFFRERLATKRRRVD